RGSLHSMRAVAGTDDFIHYADWCCSTQLGIAILLVDGQVVFDLLQMLGERREFRSLRVVAKAHVSLERSLVAEDFVVVRLVGADGYVQSSIQIHPRQVAVVVVVGEERIGPRGKKLLQRF